MIINDPLYGRFDIKEKSLTELMNSPQMQRLKGISQLGITKRMLKKGFPSYSRYEHSVGVMLLLRELGADKEEQVAGLLHDISHSAFSHVIDWVLGDPKKEDYQDNIHKKFIFNSRIKILLTKNGFVPERIANLELFSLLDRELPDLCADRIDYALRDAFYWKGINVKEIVKVLKIHHNEIVFKSRAYAYSFGRLYMRNQDGIWNNPDVRIKYFLLAEILKDALKKKIIRMKDLYEVDEYVISKLSRSKDKKITEGVSRLYKEVRFRIDKRYPDVVLKGKLRYIDPKYMKNGKIVRLSETDSKYKKLIDAEKLLCKKGFSIALE